MHSMPDTLPKPVCGPLRVVWAIPVPSLHYEGKERVYVLSGLRYRQSRIIMGVHEVPNHSPFPEDTFSVLQKDVNMVFDSLPSPQVVLGYAHTHPAGFPEPSINDIYGIARGMIGLVVSENDTHRWYVRGRTIEPSVSVSLVE